MIKSTKIIALLLICNVPSFWAHSWMSCPRSFNTSPFRGGHLQAPCERWSQSQGETNFLKAGDRLKVGWTSNNHAGGFVRIALVKATSGDPNSHFGATEAAFKKNVIKFACYGKDEREGFTKFGDCIHPCNARPGCEYQSRIDDVERFDTTITVPTNLGDGVYILQILMLVGNGGTPYYSCAKLDVTGGDPSLNCQSNTAPPTYTCHRSAGPPLSSITTGAKRGDFCYHSDIIGEVDDRITEAPVNKACDPRIFCGVSTNAAKCKLEPGMEDLDGQNPLGKCDGGNPNPTPTCTDGIKNQNEIKVDCGGVCKPCPPVATCYDGIQNQKETGVDCGGPLCPACPTCFDRIKNQNEENIDCGGKCTPCVKPKPGGNCFDGIENQSETGIDCGGPCKACPSCNDNIKNQGEVEVDCGGPCKPCGGNCFDNIKNADEEGVDCGGRCTKVCGGVEDNDYVTIVHKETEYGGGPIRVEVSIEFLRNLSKDWTLTIEYNQPLDITSAWGAAAVLSRNAFRNIYTFKRNSWTRFPKKGDVQKIHYEAVKKSSQPLRPTDKLFEIEGVAELGKRTIEVRRDSSGYHKCGSVHCSKHVACVREVDLPCTKYPCLEKVYCKKIT